MTKKNLILVFVLTAIFLITGCSVGTGFVETDNASITNINPTDTLNTVHNKSQYQRFDNTIISFYYLYDPMITADVDDPVSNPNGTATIYIYVNGVKKSYTTTNQILSRYKKECSGYFYPTGANGEKWVINSYHEDANGFPSDFEKLDTKLFPWGKGANDNALVPFKTVAVKRKIGTCSGYNYTCYIPFFDGIGYKDPADGNKKYHNGYFRAEDSSWSFDYDPATETPPADGWKYDGNWIDVFVGNYTNYKAIEAMYDGTNWWNGSVVTVKTNDGSASENFRVATAFMPTVNTSNMDSVIQYWDSAFQYTAGDLVEYSWTKVKVGPPTNLHLTSFRFKYLATATSLGVNETPRTAAGSSKWRWLSSVRELTY